MRRNLLYILGALAIAGLWLFDMTAMRSAKAQAQASSGQTVVGLQASPLTTPCTTMLVEPQEGTLFIDEGDSAPEVPGYQRTLWFEFSGSCRGRRMAVISNLGERRELVIGGAGFEVVSDFTLVSEPRFAASLANRSHEGVRLRAEWLDDLPGGGP